MKGIVDLASQGNTHSFHRRDYAQTLARWQRRFIDHGGALSEMGFGRRFLRTWRYYLAYCEAGFLTGNIDLMQTALERPA